MGKPWRMERGVRHHPPEAGDPRVRRGVPPLRHGREWRGLHPWPPVPFLPSPPSHPASHPHTHLHVALRLRGGSEHLYPPTTARDAQTLGKGGGRASGLSPLLHTVVRRWYYTFIFTTCMAPQPGMLGTTPSKLQQSMTELRPIVAALPR